MKASFAAINAAGLGPLDNHKYDVVNGGNRNALAPMAPDQQAFRYNGTYNNKHQLNGNQSATSNPLYISTTKSGRASKRPSKHQNHHHHHQQQHNASHLYPDESPTSISSDNNSVFENSESLSSTDFIETGTNFGSTSPSSLDFATGTTQANTTLYQRDERKYCLCRQVSYGEMVACDNNECEFEWFHYDCVNVTQTPKGRWYCPDCTRKMNGNQQTTQRKRGRKEKSLYNMFSKNPLDNSVRSKDGVPEQSKSIV